MRRVELRGPSCELGSRLGRKGGLSTWMSAGFGVEDRRDLLGGGYDWGVVFASSWCGGRC